MSATAESAPWIKKIGRQPIHSTSTPPTARPITGAPAITTLIQPIAFTRSRRS